MDDKSQMCRRSITSCSVLGFVVTYSRASLIRDAVARSNPIILTAQRRRLFRFLDYLDAILQPGMSWPGSSMKSANLTAVKSTREHSRTTAPSNIPDLKPRDDRVQARGTVHATTSTRFEDSSLLTIYIIMTSACIREGGGH